MKHWTIEKLDSYILENHIVSSSQLAKKSMTAYVFLKKEKLHSRYNFRTRREKITFDEIHSFIQQNGITSMEELHNLNRKYYNWLNRNYLVADSGLTPSEITKKEKVVKYDITRVLPYLIKWSEADGKTLKQTARRYGYSAEYDEYFSLNSKVQNTSVEEMQTTI